VAGFEQLAHLYSLGTSGKAEVVCVECAKVLWVDSNMAAALAAIRQVLKVRAGCQVKFMHLRTDIEKTLRDIGLFTGGRPRQSMVPLRRFDQGQSKSFAGYTQGQLADKGLPSMSDQVSKRVFEGIDEIFQNFEIHAKSDLGLFAAGQLYPKKGTLVFTLADMGVGIPEVVNRALDTQMRPSTAIDWAFSGTNTTRQGDVPGGLGLKILREFVKLNGGELAVASGAGYWSDSPEGVFRRDMGVPIPGTIVTIQVNTEDTNSYIMTDEIDPSAVF
jgi:hypothetical protein